MSAPDPANLRTDWACGYYISGERAWNDPEWADQYANGPRFSPAEPLDSEAFFEFPAAIAGDRQLGLVLVLEADEQAVDARVELVHERDVDDGRSVDTYEWTTVQMRLGFGHREVDHVLTATRNGERQLVLSEEVRHARDVEHGRAFADARCNPLQAAARRQLFCELLRERADIRRRLSAQTFELVERLSETFCFDRLQQVVDR